MTQITDFRLEVVRDRDFVLNMDGEEIGFVASRPMNIVTVTLHTDAIKPGDTGTIGDLLHKLARDALRTESENNRQTMQASRTRHYRSDVS